MTGRIGLLLLSITACGLDREGGLLAADAKLLVGDHEDTAEALAAGAALAALPAARLTASTVTLADAVEAQDGVPALLTPAGCATVESAGNQVTYTFSGCAGPWGRPVSGALVVTFAPGSGAGFSVELASADLTIDGRAASVSGSANLAFTADSRTIDWVGSLATSSAAGAEVAHDVDLSLTVREDGSASLHGTTSVTFGLRGLDVDIVELTRAGPVGTCPEGTVVVARRVGNLSAELTFDGTTKYVAETSRGGKGTFELECDPP